MPVDVVAMSGWKTCSRCRARRRVENFGRNAARKDGLNPWCRDCRRAYQREWWRRVRDSKGLPRKVTPDYQRAVALRRQGCSYAEIAAELGMKVVTVRYGLWQRLHDGRCVDCGEPIATVRGVRRSARCPVCAFLPRTRPLTPHGTENGYQNYRCRCAECREAWRVAHRKRMLDRRLKLGPCSQPDCQRGQYARGLCHTHYERQRRGKSLDPPIQRRPRVEVWPDVTT
jgi:hypothetical protein